MTEVISPIPARIKNMAIGGHVAGADDIYDEVLMENQEIINSRVNQDIININNSKGVAGGIATLGEDGKIPSAQLPSYIDTIVEGYYYDGNFYNDAAHTSLITPEVNVIYNDLPTNVSYRYSGTHYIPISNAITADEEDITVADSKLKFKNKEYSASDFSGLGRVYLRKNISEDKNVLVQSMINSANTVYIIQYDYDLLGASIQVPAGSVLQFDGGSLSNGTIVGNATQISADKTAIFKGITINGTWNVPEITSAWFGDATEDNVIKRCFNLTDSNLYNKVIIEDGTYNVDTLTNDTGAITLGSNTEVNLIGTIKQLPNSFTMGYVIDIEDKADNIHICGSGTIIGDKAEHTGTSGEWGHGINICNCSNVTVDGIKILDCWGDSVYIGYQADFADSIILRNLTLDGSRRQGISITSAKNVLVDNCIIKNINGTAPRSGIDIEPNPGSVIDNIAIKNCVITDCGGWGIDLYNVQINSMNNILIQNVIVDGCKNGIGSTRAYNITNITIDSVIIRNHSNYGLYLYPNDTLPSSYSADYLTAAYNVNIMNAYVDSQIVTQDSAYYSIWLWFNNGTINGCTFKDGTYIRSFNTGDSDNVGQLEHGLTVSGCAIIAGSKMVRLHTGGTIYDTSITCGRLLLPNGHTRFIGCTIRCNSIVSKDDDSAGSSYNDFIGCTINCANSLLLANNSNISESSVNASLIRMNNRCSISNSEISAQLVLNSSDVNVSNNKITVGLSKIGTGSGSYAIKLPGTNCRLCYNDITIQDDDQSISGTNGAVSVHGQGCIVKGNKITLSGSRSYLQYVIYVNSEYTPMTIEDTTFVASEASPSAGYFNRTSNTPIPYADISKKRTGATEDRPTLLYCNRTFQYFDTTLNRPIWWNGTAWVNCTGEDPDAVATA